MRPCHMNSSPTAKSDDRAGNAQLAVSSPTLCGNPISSRPCMPAHTQPRRLRQVRCPSGCSHDHPDLRLVCRRESARPCAQAESRQRLSRIKTNDWCARGQDSLRRHWAERCEPIVCHPTRPPDRRLRCVSALSARDLCFVDPGASKTGVCLPRSSAQIRRSPSRLTGDVSCLVVSQFALSVQEAFPDLGHCAARRNLSGRGRGIRSVKASRDT